MDPTRRVLLDGYHKSYRSRNDIDERTYKFYSQFYAKLLLPLLPRDRDSRLLDIGCGVGYLLYSLESQGYRNIVGVDIDKEQLEVCRRMVRAELALGDALSFLNSLANSGLAAVLMFDVLEHFPKGELLPICKEVLRVLHPGGVFIMRVPNMANLCSTWIRYNDLTHEMGFTESSISQLLELAGFSSVRHYSANPRLKKLSWLREATNAVLHRAVRRLMVGPIPGSKIFSHMLLSVGYKGANIA